MNTKRNIKGMLAVFVALFLLLAGYLVYIVGAYGAYWFASPYNTRVTKQKNAVLAGTIFERRGLALATTNEAGERNYAADESMRLATAHVIGDTAGQTLGAEAFFAKYLLGFDQDFGEQLSYLVSEKQRTGADIMLTVDAALSEYAYSLLEGYNGAILLMNYKTGEVLACTARPGFDPARMKDYATGGYTLAEGSMVNRATMGRYTPGSTFKIVTTIAALRYLPNVQSRTFLCSGPLVFEKESGTLVNDGVNPYDETGALREEYILLRDHEDARHGQLTLEEAFIHSCNHVFAQLALEIGETNLRKTAESLGFNGEFLFDELVAYPGTYGDAETDFELAWSGVGQHTDIITPVHLCLITCAVANGSAAMEPKLLKGVSGTAGIEYKSLAPEVYEAFLKGNEAEFLAACMRGVVQRGTGTRAAVDGYTVCGKTGTAEVSSAKNARAHAWFTGYIDSDAHPYAITVIVEQAGGGGTVAAPIAAKVLERAVKTKAQ